MPNLIRIADWEDPRLLPYRDLCNRDTGYFPDAFIAEGRLVVERLIASGQTIESLLVEEGKEKLFATRVRSEVPIYCLPAEVLRRLVGFDFHRGVIACGRRPTYLDVKSLSFSDRAARISLAVLDVDDQENMGSMMRSAAALGINQILFSPKTIDPFRRRVIRVSMANVFSHCFYRLRQPASELAMLRESGFRTVASTLDAATDLDQFQVDDRPIVLMVGNEARGIEQQIQQAASDRIRIPMRSGADSLNVAVAAAIMMYQLTRSFSK